MAIVLVLGASCRRAVPEERLRPSVVSLVRSWDSECLWAAPDGSERMVFRVDQRLSPFRAPLGNVGGAIGLVGGAPCGCAGAEELV